MVSLIELIDLFDSFWTTNKKMPGVIPRRMLENGTMYWETPETFAEKVHTWKDKKRSRIYPNRVDIDNYWVATELGLTLSREDRDLIYMRSKGWSYRKLGHLYNKSHETIRNNYLGILINLQHGINTIGKGSIKKYINLTNTHNME